MVKQINLVINEINDQHSNVQQDKKDVTLHLNSLHLQIKS